MLLAALATVACSGDNDTGHEEFCALFGPESTLAELAAEGETDQILDAWIGGAPRSIEAHVRVVAAVTRELLGARDSADTTDEEWDAVLRRMETTAESQAAMTNWIVANCGLTLEGLAPVSSDEPSFFEPADDG